MLPIKKEINSQHISVVYACDEDPDNHILALQKQ